MNPYEQVLDATIAQLERLKGRGVKHVMVSQELLQDLAKSSPLKADRAIPSPTVGETRPVSRVLESRPAPSLQKKATPAATPLPAPGLLETRSSLVEALSEEVKLLRSGGQGVSEKAVALDHVKQRALVCVKCPHLASSRTNVVFGVGNIDSPLMFVGEAPGMDEDREGEPFVGAAGQLLTKIIKAMGFSRDDVYIANVLKCRPNTPGESSGNRKPTEDEMKTCLPYLLAQIEIIQPKIIVALGGTAVEGLFGKSEGISKIRGQFRHLRNIPVMPTFHPSYLLRQQMLTEKRKVWEDMMKVMEMLNIPITEKQQGFFLKA